MKRLSSLQNPAVKRILRLQEKSRDRKAENVFVIDGWKETKMAMDNGYAIELILYREGFEPETTRGSTEMIEVDAALFDKISYRGNTSKVIAVAQQKVHALKNIQFKQKNPLVIVVDGVEKPGNLGAILRTADACGADAVICCDTQTDIYNPNVIRSSVGCVFSVPIGISSVEACFKFLKEKKIAVFTTSLKAAKIYTEGNYKKASAFVFGTEATGVNTFWEDHSDANIIIPMRGQNDSLNVSNTAAIILFEALRQRS